MNNEKNLANKTCFPLSVVGHKFGLIIWSFSLEFLMLITETCFALEDWTEEESQTLKLIRPLVLHFLAVYFPKAWYFKEEKLIIHRAMI